MTRVGLQASLWVVVVTAGCAGDGPTTVPDGAGDLDTATRDQQDETDVDTDLDTGVDAEDVEIDDGPVTITVLLDDAPAPGIRVMQGGSAVASFTDAHGQVTVAIDHTIAGEVGFVASSPFARSRGATWYPGMRALEIAMTTFDPSDNPAYVFQDPGEPTQRDSSAQCAHCHETINADWFASPHRTAAKNPVVQGIYRTGVLPALNPGCTATACDDATRFGGCADCHAPGIDGVLGGRDLREASGNAYEHGVHCDVCHRVESVDVEDARPGVAGRLHLHRPSEKSTSIGLGTWQPLTFGPDFDVGNPRMGLVQRDHFHEATLCAGCHQLEQEVLVPGAAIDRARWPTGTLPIHTTYDEWRTGPLGGATDAVPCQSCHMPPDPLAENAADLQLMDIRPGPAAGWIRPPGAVARHVFYGPRQRQTHMLELAAAVTITREVTADALVARVSVKNVGPGHALPTGEPMRSMILLVEARCGDELLVPTGGDAVPDFGGALAQKARGEDWSVWPGAAVGEVVRVIRRTGAWHDYPGVGPFATGGAFDAAAKGLPVEAVVGSVHITAVDVEGVGSGRVTFDGPVPEGDVAYRAGPDVGLPTEGTPAQAWAGAPGFAFARVLVGKDGARMVPHYAAVDVASDNRLPPQTTWTSEHRFAATCAEPEVRAVLVHRAFPLAVASANGWPLTDSVMTTVTRGPAPALATLPDVDPNPEIVRVALRAAPLTIDIDGQPVSAMAYNGQIPGPTIRVQKGQRLVVEVDNALAVPTTIHWHGLRVPYAMDGVTWQAAGIAPGGHFRYELPTTQAGTFWYHPHFDSDHEVDLGLFGAIVVEDPLDPIPSQDLVFVLDTWGESSGAPLGDETRAAPEHEHEHAPDVVDDRARVWRVNGAVSPIITLSGGTVVRARFVNASSTGYLALRWPDMAVIATDQGLLPGGRQVPADGRLVLAPGDRAEVEWRIGETGFDLVAEPWSLHGGDLGDTTGGDPVVIASVAVTAPAPAPDAPSWPFPAALPLPYDGPSDIVWVFQGSAHNDAWRINGQVFPDITPAELILGQPSVIEVRNLSATEHPFHLHGHAFEVLAIDGEPPPVRLIEDTINVGIYQSVRLGLVADNPGEWMAHCHILPHAHGMMTVLRVTDHGQTR